LRNQAAANKIPKAVSRVYVEFFQNTPLVVQVFFVYNALPYLGVTLDVFVIGMLCVGIYHGAYVSEVIRAGITSIPKGQFEAARSQGFNFIQTLIHIVLPQCFRRIIPSLMSQIITTIKDTSFFAQFAIAEFFFNSKQLMGIISRDTVISSAHIFVLYCFIALVYFTINFALSCMVRALAKTGELRPEGNRGADL
jgi:putative glutamine transport system permease protein